ncbi:MAG: phenylalanine--tRNA ligase subunit beta [Candidatus Gastranaerophilales bacterium]|nr:phenylalanine--tRNA ligase subunit beta [Candidatus Gastranaerophilales bacterium]
MKISLEWLNEFVDISNLTTEQIANGLTMSGLEVEGIETTGAKFSNIKTAQIKALRQHPNADKLHLVDVDLGNCIKTVVCGAQNIEVGQIIPYASIGSKVLSRKTAEQYELTCAVIRGIESQGMLCSQDELGLQGMQEEDGILILNRIFKDVKIGMNLETLLNIKEDTIIDVSPTPNRGDEMSVIGVAREVAALFNKKLNFSKIESTKNLNTNKFEVEIIDKDTCNYYSAGLIKDVKIKPSPEWMKRRLEVSGIRSINNVVDITNYVLLEYGQPLHAFDMDKLNGYICVRRAKEGETLVTLDDIERNLTHDTVVCATKEKPVCIAGVFGSANSGIDENTKNIVLESAYFTPHTNRKSSRSIGYRSEACARFERGVDIEASKPALLRAIQLLTEYADAKVDGIVETGLNKLADVQLTLRFNQIKRLLGIEIPAAECIQILENLGFELLGKNDAAAKLKVPSYRINDIKQEVDLIEEIARVYGYDKIAPTLPRKTQSPVILNEARLMKSVNQLFLGYGFNEAVTSSLIGEPLLNQFGFSYNKGTAVFVQNPQSEEHTMLRQTTVANILNAMKMNFDNGQKNIWLYEIGKTYFIKQPATQTDSGVEENQMISGVITGETNQNLWKNNPKIDFYTLKGIMESLFNLLKISNRIKLSPADNCEYLHPGRSAKVVMLGKNPETIGYFGEIYPIIKDKLKINQDIYLFELNLGKMIKASPDSTVKYKQLPMYPEVQRDISFSIEKDITNEQITLAIKKCANNKIFKNANLFDIYEGEHIQAGFKNLAYRITLQDEDTTLTDEVIEKEINTIKTGLMKKFQTVSFR